VLQAGLAGMARNTLRVRVYAGEDPVTGKGLDRSEIVKGRIA
jgi:hypothetical protein